MGSYMNPGKEKFVQCINSEIYIDKTGLIRYCNKVMNSLQKYISMSRPRRFGKSVTADAGGILQPGMRLWGSVCRS